jgi:hypothetical protein
VVENRPVNVMGSMNAKIILMSVLLSGLIFWGCGGSDWARRIDWPDIDTQKLPAAGDYPGEPAIILLDEGSVEVNQLSETAFSIYDRHIILKIFNSRGFRYANIAVPYNGHSEINDIEARTIGPDGKITVLNKNKIYDVNLYPNFVFYSDQRARIFTLPAVTEGSIIEYRYRITINNRTYGNQWRFQHEIPILRSRFTLIKQSEWKIDYRIFGDVSPPTVTNLPAGFKQTMIWEAGPLPPLHPEFLMPPINEVGARLDIAPVGISSWSDLASWYNGLVKLGMDKRDGLSNLADSLTTGLTSDHDKLKALFEWTRDELRYMAVEIGIGGYQPSPAEEVYFERYGDCKDMTTFLCALAEEAGIPVYQALVSTRQNGLPDTTLPSAVQFNHVIAYAPGIGTHGIWMDATDKSCAFGSLPWYDQDLDVLQVGPEGESRLTRTPASRPEENISETAWSADLDSSGSAMVNAITTAGGIIANELRAQLRETSLREQRDWLEMTLEERCPGSEVDSCMMHFLEMPDSTLEMKYRFEDPDFAELLPGMLVLKPGTMTGEKLSSFFHNDTRTLPVRIQIPVKTVFKLTVHGPEGSYPAIPVKKYESRSEFGSCSLLWDSTTEELRIRVETVIQAGEIAPASYEAFLRYLDDTRKILETPIVLEYR